MIQINTSPICGFSAIRLTRYSVLCSKCGITVWQQYSVRHMEGVGVVVTEMGHPRETLICWSGSPDYIIRLKFALREGKDLLGFVTSPCSSKM